MTYYTLHNKQQKNCHCQSTTVTNKADNKRSAVCTKHTWAAVSATQQQIYSTCVHHKFTTYAKLNLWLSWIKQTRRKHSAEMLEHLLFATSPAVQNIDSTGSEADSASRTFFGGFFRQTKIRQRMRLTAPGWGVYPVDSAHDDHTAGHN